MTAPANPDRSFEPGAGRLSITRSGVLVAACGHEAIEIYLGPALMRGLAAKLRQAADTIERRGTRRAITSARR